MAEFNLSELVRKLLHRRQSPLGSIARAACAHLAKSIQKDQKLGKKMADDIAEILMACGFCWKHEFTAQEDFQSQMKSTVRLLLRTAL